MPTPRGSWQDIHALADAAEPDVRRELLRAVADTLDATHWAQVQDALAAGDLTGASQAIPWEEVGEKLLREELPPRLMQLFDDVGTTLAAKLPRSLSIDFNTANPRALAWAQTYTATFVTEVSEATQAAIRGMIRDGLEAGTDVRTLTRTLKAIVGLTERQAQAVVNYHVALMAGGAEDDKAWKKAEKYAQKQLRYRAESIARTETLSASNHGQQELWLQMRDAGVIDSTVKREWIVTPDDKLCEICEAMGALEPVGLEELFRIRRPIGLTALVPPAHVRCRCTVALVTVQKRWGPRAGPWPELAGVA